MREIVKLFLLSLFVVPNIVFGAEKATYNGVNGTSTKIIDGKGNLAGGCAGKRAGESCSSSGASIAICKDFGGKLSCVAKVCKEGFLLELNEKGNSKGICRTEKFAKDNCVNVLKKKNESCPENQEPTPIRTNNPDPKYHDDTRVYGSCFCADKSNLKYECGDGATGTPPSVNETYRNIDVITAAQNTCSKSAATFVNWKCGSQNVDEGATFSISDKTTCVAQWQDCPACDAGTGCTCSVSVVNNQCKYSTGTQSGYVMGSGENTAAPQCELSDEGKCIGAGGDWQGGECVCTDAIPDTKFDIENQKCVCKDPNKIIEGNQCIPVGESQCKDAGGDWKDGKCVCKPEIPNSHFDMNAKQCLCDDPNYIIDGDKCISEDESKCIKAGGVWQGGECACKENIPNTKFDIESQKCICKDHDKIIEGNQCVPVGESQCKAAKGDWKDGKCVCNPEIPNTYYNVANKKCDCNEESQIIENNQCVVPTTCPKGAKKNGDRCECENPDFELVKEVVDGKDVLSCKEKTKTQTKPAPKKENKLAEKKKVYEDAKAKEQSTANKTLTALTTAATGIGGMELAMGLSEKKADEAADKDMQAYIETFRCTYGGKQVKAGIEEIELPGGNDEKLMGLRAEYVALAADLKERKEALGMKPGIESEKIYDKVEMGLYDDENIGITGGAYESLYRAKALNSEEDQAKLDEQKKEAKNRTIAGGVLVGAGVLGGIIGNSAINGKLGEAIKKAKTDKNVGKETKKALKVEENALEDLQKCLKKAGFQNTDRLSFDNFFASALSTKNVSCKDITLVGDKKSSDINATDVIPDTTDESEIFDTMTSYLPMTIVGKMIGYTLKEDSGEEDQTKAKAMLKKSIDSAKKKIEDAAKADEAANKSSSEESGGILGGVVNSDTIGTLTNMVTNKTSSTGTATEE